MESNFLKDLIIAIIAGIVSGLVVGNLLYSWLENDPILYVSCSKGYDLINISIENVGKPAIDVYICPTPERGLCFFPKKIDKIGRDNFIIQINVEEFREKIVPFTNKSLFMDVSCNNCDSKKIKYSQDCFNL